MLQTDVEYPDFAQGKARFKGCICMVQMRAG